MTTAEIEKMVQKDVEKQASSYPPEERMVRELAQMGRVWWEENKWRILLEMEK